MSDTDPKDTAMTRAADILWRSYAAPRYRVSMAARDARKILRAALAGNVLAPTESEIAPWPGYKAIREAKRNQEGTAMRCCWCGSNPARPSDRYCSDECAASDNLNPNRALAWQREYGRPMPQTDAESNAESDTANEPRAATVACDACGESFPRADLASVKNTTCTDGLFCEGCRTPAPRTDPLGACEGCRRPMDRAQLVRKPHPRDPAEGMYVCADCAGVPWDEVIAGVDAAEEEAGEDR